MVELGGFVKLDKVKEENLEEVKKNNNLLAKTYLYAIKNEMFDAINTIDISKIDEVCYWLNYDSIVGKELEEEIELVRTGKIETSNSRSFRDACLYTGFIELASCFDNRNDVKKRVKRL